MRKKKTRYRVPGRAGGMAILKMHPEVDGRKKNIYFSKLGKLGGKRFVELYGTKPDESGSSVGMYPCK